ncbi:hypothetical protein AUEXF2481DRAFT_42244 [Aureobasidium subglaciale EXF-2481]|uniref:Uncharacterized protein n=1 Tax=Aureobasidium subglaciale (strain EXF-2481) TaxID=1043005 RepID=A0A074Y5H2_AURSE|nr:uncharacterized protein AUEXF2481DRAFT_42244 [Aureobasidium subglaciale EXF-2481]KEQ93043.1 hypothetical protein AUEXF2481DRAFT_42244 [Aureobasidium subglaciale EXF-2481]
MLGLAQTYTKVTSVFSNNHAGYQPLDPPRGAVHVVQSKGSRFTRKLLLASIIVSIVVALAFLVSHTCITSMVAALAMAHH